MTGKEVIIHYLETHKSFCAQDVAAATGVTVTCINQAAAKMARAGILVIDGKVWRTVYYRFATREEREGKVGNDSNLLIVFYVQIMPDDFVMQLHRF
ncbi:protein ren [Escherichia coli]|nr:protein ren [Escherichia coli]